MKISIEMDDKLFRELERDFKSFLLNPTVDHVDMLNMLEKSTDTGPWESPPIRKGQEIEFLDGVPGEDYHSYASGATSKVKTTKPNFHFLDVLKYEASQRGRYSSNNKLTSIRWKTNVTISARNFGAVLPFFYRGYVGGIWTFGRKGYYYNVKSIRLFQP